MVLSVKKSPGIDVIFKKDSDGYSQDSLLYQDILKYAAIIKAEHPENGYNNCFRERELTNWLLKNNQEFINDFKDISTRTTKYQNRVENRLPRVRGKLEQLIECGLIEISGQTKASKNNDFISLFKYTIKGYFLVYLIEGLNSSKRTEADNEIYNLCPHLFKGSVPGADPVEGEYYLTGFNLLKKGGQFENYVDGGLRNVIRKGAAIREINDIFNLADAPQDVEDSEIVSPNPYEGYRKVIDEMDAEKRNLYLYNEKLKIEEKMSKNGNMHEYEKLRFQIREKHDAVAVLGICRNCRNPIPRVMGIYKYLQTKYRPNRTFVTSCPKCDQANSVIYLCP